MTIKYGSVVTINGNEGKVINIQDEGKLAVVLLDDGSIRSVNVKELERM